MKIIPYYQDDYCTIYHGDCREILPHLPKVDLVLTDPPYGIGIDKKSHKNNRTGTSKKRWGVCNVYPAFNDALHIDPAPFIGTPCCLWGGNYFADRLPATSGWLVWDKERPDDLDQSTCELAWTNFVKGVRRFKWLWNGCMRADSDQLQHPTQKPVALMKWVLTLRWTPNGLILDPFMGSGTTLRAAKDLGRKSIGIEIEEKYCEIAAKRMAQEVMGI